MSDGITRPPDSAPSLATNYNHCPVRILKSRQPLRRLDNAARQVPQSHTRFSPKHHGVLAPASEPFRQSEQRIAMLKSNGTLMELTMPAQPQHSCMRLQSLHSAARTPNQRRLMPRVHVMHPARPRHHPRAKQTRERALRSDIPHNSIELAEHPRQIRPMRAQRTQRCQQTAHQDRARRYLSSEGFRR